MGLQNIAFVEWLRGIVSGGYSNTLPQSIELFPALRHNVGIESAPFWSSRTVGPLLLEFEKGTKIEGPAMIVLVAGRGHGRHEVGYRVDDVLVRCVCPTDDALIATDAMRSSAPPQARAIAEVLAVHVHSAIQRASELDEALATGDPLSSVIRRRTEAGQRAKLPDNFGNLIGRIDKAIG